MNIYDQSVKNYLRVLVGRVHKVLPLYEDLRTRRTLFIYIQSLLYEFDGMPDYISDVRTSADFNIIYSTLNSISDDSLFDDDNLDEVRREVFKCTGLIGRIYEKRFNEKLKIVRGEKL